ncbi:MAG TPA: hypothetical protein VHG08_10535, partial [Longimicrobium sp.]|nr:hypothetical protein [Longimicrobium sp.]
MTHRRPSAPARTGTSLRRILLIALLATGCSDDVTGPRTAAEGPPADDMRVASITMTDTAWKSQTLHRFLYDDAGRLERVNFYVSQVPNGPPTWNTFYMEHTYAGSVLTETNYFRLSGTGEYANFLRINYDYDRLGYLIRRTTQRARISDDPVEQRMVDTFTTRYRYDRRGRLAEELQDNGERTVYEYGDDGSLALTELSQPNEPHTLRHTFSYAGGRNPFYRRLAHVNSLILPVRLETELLAPSNLARQETLVDSDPTVISSITHQYQFDSEGRPLRIRQVILNDHLPESRGVV